MDGKTIGALIAGVVIGLAVGFALWHTDASEPPPQPDNVEETRGDWPEVACPPGGTEMSAADACDEISRMAGEAQPMSQDTMYCAVRAQQVKQLSPADEEAASTHVHNAYQAAKGNDWVACRNELDQID